MMIDTEGTELKPGDIVEWLRMPGKLHMVTEKQDGGENFAGDAMIRVKCMCSKYCQDRADGYGTSEIFYFMQHQVRLVERMPTPEYYKHTRSG